MIIARCFRWAWRAGHLLAVVEDFFADFNGEASRVVKTVPGGVLGRALEGLECYVRSWSGGRLLRRRRRPRTRHCSTVASICEEEENNLKT